MVSLYFSQLVDETNKWGVNLIQIWWFSLRKYYKITKPKLGMKIKIRFFPAFLKLIDKNCLCLWYTL